ncbi:MAG: hypothetical protein ACE5FG_12405 [Myxococcota bacterium]
MLSRFDDFPVHQVPEPIAHAASSDRNVYDRYWFNGYARDAEYYFGIGMGLYPNRGILDCGFSIVRDGEQHAFHASRRAPADPSETQVGPFRIEVLEPMRELRVILEPNETGLECDLHFRARTACLEEGRQTLRSGGRVIMDATRFAQLGRWQGVIQYAGQRLTLDPARVYGTKDRSWGLRPVGEPETGGAPPQSPPQVFFLWAPIHWETRCTHFLIFEDADGVPWHEDAMIVPAYASPGDLPGVEDPATEHLVGLEHRLEYEPGTRRARHAELRMVSRAGERYEIELEPQLCFRMKGIGYTHPEWGHGRWQGELAVAGESWKTEALDPLALENQHIQQVVRARMRGEEGVGVLEQLAFGPHARYGFTEFLDGAR